MEPSEGRIDSGDSSIVESSHPKASHRCARGYAGNNLLNETSVTANVNDKVNESVNIIIDAAAPQKVNSIFQKYLDLYNNNKSNFLDNFGLNDIINNVNTILSDFSHQQLGAVVHISGSIAILYSLFTIVSRLRREID